jgi:hypothetical protein
MRWVGRKIKNIHSDGIWWAESLYHYPPSNSHIGALDGKWRGVQAKSRRLEKDHVNPGESQKSKNKLDHLVGA